MSKDKWLDDLFQEPSGEVVIEEVLAFEETQADSNEQKSEVMTLEKGLENLELIVKTLEQKDLPLEKALNLFKEGVGLIQHCSNVLDLAEKQMEILLEGPDGQLQIRPASFDGKDEQRV
ncbi:Exodeoxyribonuclease VII small subunit [Desulfosporosinus sp. I2]|uniref:exodeoxyribonuclease VII small subunit n=1 Tax=Desulfosporosinus sp. I2 TaxID=1617025 RepID=UPI00061EEEA2|nr:Exodeoxyribonuclease VII small subunit [Desulfosporosinus sp. I2]